MTISKGAWTFLFISVLAVVVAACGDREKTESTQGEVDSRMVRLCQDSIKKQMKDPGSTEFRDVFVSRISGKAVVCGEVNSKNSFGGYVGFQRVISSSPEATFLASDLGDVEMGKLWQSFCGK